MTSAKAAGEPLTLLDVLNKAEGFLAQKGCPSPRLDAQVLMAHVLDCDRVRLYVDYAKPLREEELDAYRELIRSRATREPVAYLTGVREFWSLSFKVDRRVLIPRPDTETLVEEIRELIPDPGPERFVDVGTGSGCLAGALADVFPEAMGVAVDSDPAALELAGENLSALGSAGRVDLKRGHLGEPIAGHRFDLVCANLPYIPSAELATLDPDVRLFEPLGALDGGPDGLTLVRELIHAAPGMLRDQGWLVLEVGAGQAPAVVELCRDAGLGEVRTRNDLAGLERVVSARRVQPTTGPSPGRA